MWPFLVLTCLVACQPETAAPVPLLPKPPHTLLASLEHGGNHMGAPIYTIDVYRDGDITYRGKRYVVTRGEAHGRATAAQLAAIDVLFEQARFFALADSYSESVWSDGGDYAVAYSDGTRTKHIAFSYRDPNAPEILSRLIGAFDLVIDSERWVGATILTGAATDPRAQE